MKKQQFLHGEAGAPKAGSIRSRRVCMSAQQKWKHDGSQDMTEAGCQECQEERSRNTYKACALTEQQAALQSPPQAPGHPTQDEYPSLMVSEAWWAPANLLKTEQIYLKVFSENHWFSCISIENDFMLYVFHRKSLISMHFPLKISYFYMCFNGNHWCSCISHWKSWKFICFSTKIMLFNACSIENHWNLYVFPWKSLIFMHFTLKIMEF